MYALSNEFIVAVSRDLFILLNNIFRLLISPALPRAVNRILKKEGLNGCVGVGVGVGGWGINYY